MEDRGVTGEGEHPLIDLWVVALDGEGRSGDPWEVLDAAERVHADARRGDGRRRYVVAHAALRMVLAATLGVEPASVVYERKCGKCGAHDHGRPGVSGCGSLSFSLSHSGERAIVAVGPDLRIGADVEAVRPRIHLDRLASRVLTPEEHEGWSSGGGGLNGFLEAWTAKEAYLKATGEGISRPLRSVSAQPPEGWSIERPTVGEGYVCAVVAETPRLRLRHRAWQAGAPESMRGR